jgi:hypothetical protein
MKDKVQKIDRRKTAPSSKTLRDKLTDKCLSHPTYLNLKGLLELCKGWGR